ncbi:hypothetical protein B6U81_01205 [Thermoplasmatales archaeon ex4484_30]|nr:MAG: hypothetical protein B6U81_01205 [Thermoplasmatales archaeon ex4484_30]RLF45491.1 MAG: hypothetical protein DRN29_06620 [Thermoplasmata archaeon]
MFWKEIKKKFLLDVRFRTVTLFMACYTIGIVTFHFLENASWLDSFYWIVITLSTVGYGDLTPHSPLMKIIVFPIVLVGIVVFASITGLIVEEQQARLRGLKPSRQNKHVIILGYNDAAESAIQELKGKYEITLVDNEQDVNPKIEENIHFIRGDPKKEESLLRANIEKAEFVLITLKEDSDAILATLAVRNLNEKAKIIVSISSMENVRRARAAGAHVVVTVDALAGRFLASAVFEENVVKFFEDVSSGKEGYDIVEIDAKEMKGKKVKDIILQNYKDGLLLAVSREGRLFIKPDLEMEIEKDDKLLFIREAIS